jgi:predicted nuclease with RNAse H fold
VLTLGIDLSAQPKRTAACMVRWGRGDALVEYVELGLGDEQLIVLIDGAEKVGIDVPFGWPDAFVAAVAAHHEFGPWPPVTSLALRMRRTDVAVRERTGRWPLSVSTDRLGVAAFRAARLLSRWGPDRAGSGKFVEVYPRGGRDCFGLGRERSLEYIIQAAPWLTVDTDAAGRIEASEDCFDALIACLVARAAALELCEPIPGEDRAAASREGWIALPREGSLELLAARRGPPAA